MCSRKGAFLTLVVFIFSVSPTRADVLTLLCTLGEGVITIDVDTGRQVICPRGQFWPTECRPAQISDRYIEFMMGKRITVDRRTGIIHYADGSTGSGQRVEEKKF